MWPGRFLNQIKPPSEANDSPYGCQFLVMLNQVSVVLSQTGEWGADNMIHSTIKPAPEFVLTRVVDFSNNNRELVSTTHARVSGQSDFCLENSKSQFISHSNHHKETAFSFRIRNSTSGEQVRIPQIRSEKVCGEINSQDY